MSRRQKMTTKKHSDIKKEMKKKKKKKDKNNVDPDDMALKPFLLVCGVKELNSINFKFVNNSLLFLYYYSYYVILLFLPSINIFFLFRLN